MIDCLYKVCYKALLLNCLIKYIISGMGSNLFGFFLRIVLYCSNIREHRLSKLVKVFHAGNEQTNSECPSVVHYGIFGMLFA